jgi:uncharacterized membrane protein YkvA (DUF1232 family)
MSDTFTEILRNNVKDYYGDHFKIVRKAPHLFEMATRLIRDSQVKMETRLKLLAAIGYFILPDDLYPEDEHGAIGYVEDIMLLLHIFREINIDYGKGPLTRNWGMDEKELISALGEEYNDLKASFPLLYEEVIKFTGV